MIRALSLAAALAILPLSSALAGDDPVTPAEAAIEAAAEAFEARMEAFGERAEAISEDDTLSAAAREARIAALWAEYQPEVAVFTAAISQHAGAIAQQALADIDVEALVAESLNDPEVQSAMVGATNMASNGAWAQSDPEQMITYGLMAQYGIDQAMDEIGPDGIEAEIAQIAAQVAHDDAMTSNSQAQADHQAHMAAGHDH